MAKPTTQSKPKPNDYVLLATGIFLILVPLAFDILFPQLFIDAQNYLRLIASLGGGLVGISIPGIIHLDFAPVRASGALALVVLFYMKNPAATFNAHTAQENTKNDSIASDFDVSENVDRPRFNLPNAVKTTDLAACQTACLSNDACKAFVIRKTGQTDAGCYLKSEVDTNVVTDPCCTTGIRHKPAHYEMRASYVDDVLACFIDGYPIQRFTWQHGGNSVRDLDPFLHPQRKAVHQLKCQLVDIAGTDGHPCWGWSFMITRNDEVINTVTSGDQCHDGAVQVPTLNVPYDLAPISIRVE